MTGSRGLALVAGALAAAAMLAAMAGTASAGELVYKGCTSSRSPVNDGRKVCNESGLDRVFSEPVTLGLSPDGGSLYTGSGIWCNGQVTDCYPSSTVGRFNLDPGTGSLDYRDCVTGVKDAIGNCNEIPGATPGSLYAGLGDVQSLIVSPDGKSMYAASPNPLCGDFDCSGGNALARFDRDPTTGAISYRNCLTGDKRSGPSGSGACSEIPGATADGGGTGVDGLQTLAVSPDGTSLYTAAANSDAIATFARNPNGKLAYRGCITGDTRVGPSGSGACAQIPTATDFGTGSGLDSAGEFLGHIPAGYYPIVVSPDGKSVYLGAAGDGSIAQFDRDPATGKLSYVGCIASKGNEVAGRACTTIPGGVSVESLVMSPDGKFIYALARSGIAQLRRDAETGDLTYVRAVTGGPGGTMALGDNGRSIYTGSLSYRRVSHYSVDPKSGRPHYEGCLTGDSTEKSCTPIRTATGRGLSSGLEKIGEMVASGRMLYAYSTGRGTDIAHFALAPQTRIDKAKTRGHRATFEFRATPKSKFKCKLKGKHVKGKLRHWRRCGSHGPKPKGRETYRHLRPGKKIFRVRATDRSSTTDPTPAKHRWHVG
jgi:DNA-binding beta-propeller fold protein YncE